MSKVQLLAAGKITALIETVQKTGAAYQEVLHTALVQCVAHAEKHGDRSLLARLVGGAILSKKGDITEEYPGVLSKATVAREIKLWIHEHTPLRFQRIRGTQTDAIVVSKTAVEKGQTYDLDMMQDQPFWDLPANANGRLREITPDNIIKLIQSARKRFEKALDAGTFTGDPVAVKQYLDAVEAVEMPKANKRRIVHADLEGHNDDAPQGETDELAPPPAVVNG